MFKKRDNFITKATEWPFKKFNLTVIIALSVILFFNDLLFDPLNSYVVSPFLSKIKSGTVSNWVTVIFIVLVLIYFYGKIKRNYYYTGKRVTIYTVIITWYSINRIDSDRWIFARFSDSNTWNNIAYLDMLYVLAPPILFYFCEQSGFKETKLHKTIYIKLFKLEKTLFDCLYNCTKRIKKLPLKISEIYTCLKKAPKIKKSDLILDNPIENGKIDCLYRDKIAKDISDILKNIESKTSFAVGITSKWGDGKTSFLKMLTSELEKKDKEAIHIEFSPWYCKTEKDIIALFFDTVSTSLKHYHSSLNNQLKKYSKLLLSIEESSLSKTIDKGLSIFEEHSDVRSIYDSINESIQNLKRTIYITIDDVDRLLAKEIIECFKIIRNTANFGNVIYIVAYDADYVDKALESGLNNTYKGYIDKIIQLPFQLPVIEKSLILKYLEDRLKDKNIADDIITEILYPKYVFSNMSQPTLIEKDEPQYLKLAGYFSNLRECNKVLNIFFTYKNILKDEVDLPDLFLVSILKTFYPTEARELYSNYTTYIGLGEEVRFQEIITDQKDVKYHIKELHKEDSFIDLVEAIFCKKETTIRSASQNLNYYTYYNGVLPSNFVSYKDYENAVQSKEKLFKLIDTIENYKKSNLFDKLVNTTSNKHFSIEIIIQGLFYFKINDKEYEDNDLITDAFNLLKCDTENFLQILESLLKSDIIFLKDTATLISRVKYLYTEGSQPGPGYELITSFDDRATFIRLLNLSDRALKIAVKNNFSLRDLIFEFYNRCYIKFINNKEQYSFKAKGIIRTYALENYSDVLKNLKTEDYKNQNNYLASPFYIDGIIQPEFGELVEKGLIETPDDKKLIEMRDYYNEHSKIEPAKIED